jgi:hypothetical protein
MILCTDVDEVTNVGEEGFTVLDFEGLDGRLELEEEFKLVLSGGFSLLEFGITVVTELVSLGEEVGVSLDLSGSLEGDGGFLVNGVLESFDVGNRLVVLVSKSGNNSDEVVLGVVEVVRIFSFLVVDGVSGGLEVGEHVVKEVSDFSDVVDVEVSSGLGLDQLVVDGEDLVGVSGSDSNSEEGVDNLDEGRGNNTEGGHFEFVEDVFSFVDSGDGLVDVGSSGLVEGDLGSSGGSQVVELLVVDGEGLGSEVTEVVSSGLFVLSEVELGLGSIVRGLSVGDFTFSEFVFFSEFFSLLGVEGEVLVVFILDLSNEVVKEFVELVVDLEVVGLEEVDEVSEGDGLLSLGVFDFSGVNLEWLGLLEGCS